MKLIGNSWHDRWQLLTVKISAYLSAFFTLMILFSEQILQVWNAVPDEIKSKIPENWMAWIGLLVSVAMVFARLKPQPKLHPEFAINTLMSAQPNNGDLAWMIEAKKHIGLKEVVGSKHSIVIQNWLKSLGAWWSDDETPWCGVYVAHCLKTAGIKYPKNWFRALDYLSYGAKLAKPAYGCVAVKTRKGGGHVCFVVGRSKDGRLVCLGGNQSNMVCYALYNESDFEAFMWYGKTNKPALHRYDLPIMNNVTATKVTEA